MGQRSSSRHEGWGAVVGSKSSLSMSMIRRGKPLGQVLSLSRMPRPKKMVAQSFAHAGPARPSAAISLRLRISAAA